LSTQIVVNLYFFLLRVHLATADHYLLVTRFERIFVLLQSGIAGGFDKRTLFFDINALQALFGREYDRGVDSLPGLQWKGHAQAKARKNQRFFHIQVHAYVNEVSTIRRPSAKKPADCISRKREAVRGNS
jgi:hypothetical protein